MAARISARPGPGRGGERCAEAPGNGEVNYGARRCARLRAATDGARDTDQVDVAALHKRDREVTEGLHEAGA
ncbi:hypothetical protein GCM10010353_55800 [Streptomyces chryseus]|uniref:Uncharacterized protein n=1 Tax=Streptomyces chryseus TaxID=68186 RepID=A0ABQ3E6T7_9ACTN|nr:hypothetical protein GCM10010353_55800 [Streptomyces chryseus]GHB24358.1 hypothetical protein GCM10010346_55150 [Streptomyces chryseus]